MKEIELNNYINKLINPDFEVLFDTDRTSEIETEAFVLGSITRAVNNSFIHNELNPSVFVKINGNICFNETIHIKLPYSNFKYSDLEYSYGFDLVLKEDVKEYLFCFISDSNGEIERCLHLDMNTFLDLTILDFCRFVGYDENKGEQVSIQMRWHSFNPKNKTWLLFEKDNV